MGVEFLLNDKSQCAKMSPTWPSEQRQDLFTTPQRSQSKSTHGSDECAALTDSSYHGHLSGTSVLPSAAATPRSILKGPGFGSPPISKTGSNVAGAVWNGRGIYNLKGNSSSGKKRSFPCSMCGFVFGMRSNLKRHVLTVHEDRRTFRCETCQASFGLKQNLETHVRVKHHKQRPFSCDACALSFGYKQVLQNHRRNIHGL